MRDKFSIKGIDRAMEIEIRDKIDNLTKPKGSLGRLEELALQIALIQQTFTPELKAPHNILFAADHGIIEEGVSVSPKEVTWQQLGHFSKGGAGINFLCEQHGFRLVLVDAGVDYDIPEGHGIIDAKIRKSTRNYLHEAAMTRDEFERALLKGGEVMAEVVGYTGCNVVSFGEMGSGNTSSASLWMHLLCGKPIAECVGAGAGLNNEGVKHKIKVLSAALKNYSGSDDIKDKLAWFGGYEMVMALGAMLKAAELGVLIIVDGFIMTACAMAAARFFPEIKDYMVFGHLSDEGAHRDMLSFLGVRPLLHLDMRLGEGSGAVCAYPIIESAVRMINRMDSFKSVNVTKYF